MDKSAEGKIIKSNMWTNTEVSETQTTDQELYENKTENKQHNPEQTLEETLKKIQNNFYKFAYFIAELLNKHEEMKKYVPEIIKTAQELMGISSDNTKTSQNSQ